MTIIFFLAFIGAIIASIIFFKNNKAKHFYFGLAAIVIALAGMAITAPSSASKGTSTKASTQVKSTPKIETKEISVKSSIPFDTVNQDDNSINSGDTKVIQEGVNGEKTTIYTVTYKDGVEQSRVQKSESITTQPINKIIAIGTYIASTSTPTTSDSSGATALCMDGSLSYSATHRGTCSHHGGVSVWYK